MMTQHRSITRVLSSSTALSLVLQLGFAPISQAHAGSLPTGASVAAGQVAVGSSGAAMTVTQSSDKAIVNWNSFSVGNGYSVNFVQPDQTSAILNRVTGTTTSTIAGSVTGNGQVYLINPNGIAITSGGSVKVGGGFVASTLDMKDEDFLSGKLSLEGNGASAAVSNQGVITVGRGGYAALIGGTVSNDGVIAVPLGKVGLGSGEQATLDLSSDGFLQVALPTKAGAEGKGALVENQGTVSADGGTVVIAAATAREAARNAINMSGVVEARTVAGREGEIVLGGGEGGRVAVSGKVKATAAAGKGGKVKVTGKAIALAGAEIDASGGAGGGSVKIGGDRQGSGDTQRAETTSVDAATVIRADATEAGKGGDIVVWSDQKTDFAGLITARGAGAGNGGEAEVSSKAVLAYTGYADLSAASGTFGTLLLDPYNITISSASASNSSGLTATGNDSIINVKTLETALAGANVTVTTGNDGSQTGNITLASDLSWSANTLLTLSAAGSVSIAAALKATGTSAGLVLTNASYTIADGGSVTLSGANATLSIGGNAYTLIHTFLDLDSVNYLGLSGRYALANDLDLSDRTFNDSLISTGTNGFTGVFAGLGNTISSLTINSTKSYVGLFSTIGAGGAVRDLDLSGGSVTSTGDNVGSLAGYNYGSISSISSTQTVAGKASVGGLVGNNQNIIQGSSFSGSVIAGPGVTYASELGGLVGSNSGTIANSSSAGSVSGASNVGGLAGLNSATITGSHSSAKVTGTSSYHGGLVGGSSGSPVISNSHATGDVSGSFGTGGLVGFVGGLVLQSYATGNVTSNGQSAGGLAGIGSGVITNSYATGNVSGKSNVGGFIGQSSAIISNSYATGAVTVSDTTVGGFVGYTSGQISNSWSSGLVTGSSFAGGFVGQNYSSIKTSYWDMGTSGKTTGSAYGQAGVTGLTTAQARTSAAYSGWNFSTDWYQTGDMRPILRSEAATAGSDGVIAISNLHQLALMGANLSGSYRLVADIDASETDASKAAYSASGIWASTGWVPVGPTGGSRFTGTLDGRGRTISNLKINSASSAVGLFGYVDTNGILENFSLTGSIVTSGSNAGSIAGYNYGSMTQVNSSASVKGNQYIGGLVGENSGKISQSSASGAITGTGAAIGGLVGTTRGGLISQSFASGEVKSSGVNVGGLVGSAVNTTIRDAYTTGSVTGYNYVGGLIGDAINMTVERTFAEGKITASGGMVAGGLIGSSLAGTVTSSYFNTETAGLTNGVGYGDATGITGLTTAQMQTKGSYSGWDFRDVWYIKNGSYPVLRALTPDLPTGISITITANSFSRGYGDGNPGLTWSITTGALEEGDSVTGQLATTATTTSGVGTYAITQGTLAISDAYDITFVGGTLTITQRAITVTADNLSKTYGNANPNLTWTVTDGSLVNGDTLAGTLSTTADKTSNVGSYDITQGTLDNANYAISFASGTLTINKRAITVTADSKSKAYGDANPDLTWSVTNGNLVNGDNLSGALQTTANSASSVGAYNITQGTLAASANYDMTFASGALTVKQRAITVTADNMSKTYGEANPGLTWTVSQGNLVNGDTLSGALSTAADKTSNVGSYDITRGTLDNANYAISFTSGTLTINKRAITVTADNRSKTYGDANPDLTWSISEGSLVNGDSLTGGLLTKADATSSVGSYKIAQGTLSASDNYALSFTGGTLTITQRAITVTADNLSKTYGDAIPNFTWTVTDGSLVNGDTLSGTLSTTADKTSNVGAYDIIQGTLDNANYAISFASGTLAVKARAIKVTAADQYKTYGDANPDLTWSISEGNLVNGDSISGSLATTANGASSVGSYAIGQDTLAASSNYALTFAAGALTVKQRAITVAANDRSKTYGDTNPDLTWTVSKGGLVNGDTLSGALSTTADAKSAVGKYDITQGTLDNANYAITYEAGQLKVNQREITVTADSLSRIYGDANPDLTWAVTKGNLVNGDSLTGGLFTKADATSNIGLYEIAQGNLSASNNYALTFTAGSLTVKQRAITVAANNQSRLFSLDNPDLTWAITAGNLVNGDQVKGQLATEATAASPVGEYVISRGSLTAGDNYDLTVTQATLSVTPVPATPISSQLPESLVSFGDANTTVSSPPAQIVVLGSSATSSDIATNSISCSDGAENADAAACTAN
ncbi:filamentous hemagglutinin family protein [Neorhizobium galegae]|uniref:MBG domain-containing protein n=1 Tax=Neorhizobium galegae TaxID=399 RepID=UPI001AEB98EA|nr:MBG domain-containing protein [Neorhizobium galegae]MBP2551603.1 filamentous hemagglutinin family protein [Neorhizobium galegae]